MNEEAVTESLRTGFAHFYSRSRQKQWMKGESSGETMKISEILTDCDQDALVVKVKMQGLGAACHTGRKSCFYRAVNLDAENGAPMSKSGAEPLFDPREVYKP